MSTPTQPRTYPHGVPCWVDVEQPDVDAALTFYGALFGWTFTEELPPDDPGRYVLASLGGQEVAAIASPPDGSAVNPEWVTYIAVDDVEGVAQAVPATGGSLLSRPESIGPLGRMATVQDPDGARFRLWQPGTRPGAQRVNTPGTWNFSNLLTPDPARALGFYGPLLGWELDPDLGAGMFRVPGYGDHLARTVDPGIHERQEFAPPGFADVAAGVARVAGPARWDVAFSVADRDESAAAAEKAGGVVVSTSENEWVREAVVRDPQGAEVTLSQFAPQEWGGAGARA
ncbi:VOC family protein [Oerskovia turbata]